MNASPLRLGTRGSDLALYQAEEVRDLLSREAPMRDVDLVEVKTLGDKVQDRPVEAIGRTAVFTAELDLALQEGRVDLAVHSLKDVETELAPGQVLAAVLPRGPVEDALVAALPLAELPAGARIGTGSVRRRAQLARLRSDLEVVAVRGNVPTRLRKLDEGALDALLMARAGLVRLGHAHRIAEILDTEDFMPPVGQGAICVTCREDDDATRRLLRGLDHAPTRRVVDAERAALRLLGGGCNVPLGVSFTYEAEELRCRAAVWPVSGADEVVRVDLRLAADTDPEEIGGRVAEALRRGGAEPLLAAWRPGS